MDSNFYVSVDLDSIGDLIKILKRAKKQMKELSNDGELPVEVTLKNSTISELVVGTIKYKEEYKVGVKL